MLYKSGLKNVFVQYIYINFETILTVKRIEKKIVF